MKLLWNILQHHGENKTVNNKVLLLLRPNGKFLSTSAGRYIIGREALALMGVPIHRLTIKDFSESVTWKLVDRPLLQHPTTPWPPKVLHSLAGNAMAMRSILPVACAAFAACVPEKMAL